MTNNDAIETARMECMSNIDKNVFVMMRYGTQPQFADIESTIRDTLLRHGLKTIIAKDVDYAPTLWDNVKFCMEYSRYGVVVFEDITGKPTHNPNIALELGYMLALGKRCLILKDNALETLPTDVIGHLYKPFNSYNIRETMSSAIERWLHNVLGSSLISPAETITDDDLIKARGARTERIIEEYERIEKSGEQPTIRLAGLLSALAVSQNERHDEDVTSALLPLYLRERDALLNLLQRGVTIRCIVSPGIYVQRLRDHKALTKNAQSYYLPRYQTLIDTIKTHLYTEGLQLVWAEQLPRHGLIISGRSIAFLGTRTTHDYRIRTTIIYDPTLIDHEIEEFEYAFQDTIMQFRARKHSDSTGDKLNQELKLSVVKELEECQDRLKNIVAANH